MPQKCLGSSMSYSYSFAVEPLSYSQHDLELSFYIVHGSHGSYSYSYSSSATPAEILEMWDLDNDSSLSQSELLAGLATLPDDDAPPDSIVICAFGVADADGEERTAFAN